jgi:RHS repeat-associated protein
LPSARSSAMKRGEWIHATVRLGRRLVARVGAPAASSRRRRGLCRWAAPLARCLALVGILQGAAPATVGAQGPVVEYYALDALGSVRVVTDANGQVLRRHDYHPFGEEYRPPTGQPDRRLFTAKERDAETGLDYFGARYYRADLGRFTTVDPGHVGGDVSNFQTWNAYAYAGNNPLRNIDPDGRRWFAKNGNAVWVDPTKDGSYTSPGEGWVELDPKNYNYGINVAFVNGQLSRIGEDAAGGKMLAPWMPPEQGLEDTSFSLFSTLWMAGTAVRAGTGAMIAARSGGNLAGELSFTGTAGAHMAEAGRRVPIHTLAEAIKHGTRMPDPQGAAGAVKIVQQVFVNGVPRTLEIIYREPDKTILHFLYK